MLCMDACDNHVANAANYSYSYDSWMNSYYATVDAARAKTGGTDAIRPAGVAVCLAALGLAWFRLR